MDQFELAVSTRSVAGKGASRRLRREKLVPAIVYGGESAPESIQVDKFELVNHMKHEAFYSHVLTLNFGDRNESVVLKDVQRHPFKPEVLHVDFQRVVKGEQLNMHVPLHFINEDKCAGVKAGGLLAKQMNEIEITCLPQNLPEYIEVDLANLNTGEAIHLADLKLAEGLTITALAHGGDSAQPVVSVSPPKGGADAEEEGGEAGEEG